MSQDFEANKELIGVIRFLIRDQAFSDDFLITTIIEYLVSHKTRKWRRQRTHEQKEKQS